MEKQGTVLGQAGQLGRHEERHNQYDSWTLQLGLDKDIGDHWQMQARMQRGSTDRFTEVFNEIRVDREMLAIDAVEVYTDRAMTTTRPTATRPTSSPTPDRGTGTIICNVQRYNPTDAQLQAVGRRLSACRPRRATIRSATAARRTSCRSRRPSVRMRSRTACR